MSYTMYSMNLDKNILVKPETVDNFAKRLNNGVQTDVITLDFSKAFDT